MRMRLRVRVTAVVMPVLVPVPVVMVVVVFRPRIVRQVADVVRQMLVFPVQMPVVGQMRQEIRCARRARSGNQMRRMPRLQRLSSALPLM